MPKKGKSAISPQTSIKTLAPLRFHFYNAGLCALCEKLSLGVNEARWDMVGYDSAYPGYFGKLFDISTHPPKIANCQLQPLTKMPHRVAEWEIKINSN